MPVGPVSTDPTVGSVVDASLRVVAATPDPVGAALVVVVDELCDEPHAAANMATVPIEPMSTGYRSLDRPCRPRECCMVACVGVFIAHEYRRATPFVNRFHNFLGVTGLPGAPTGGRPTWMIVLAREIPLVGKVPGCRIPASEHLGDGRWRHLRHTRDQPERPGRPGRITELPDSVEERSTNVPPSGPARSVHPAFRRPDCYFSSSA